MGRAEDSQIIDLDGSDVPGSPAADFVDFSNALHAIVREAALRASRDLPGIAEAAEGTVLICAGIRPSMQGVYRSNVWHHAGELVGEITLNANYLIAGAEELLTTALHEIVHAYNFANGVKDTSRDGRYHSRKFGEVAALLGLRVGKDQSGCTTPGLSERGLRVYGDLLPELESSIRLVRRGAVHRPEPNESDGSGLDALLSLRPLDKKYVFASCACSSESSRPVTIRVARGSWRPGVIECRACGQPFRPEGSLSESRQSAPSPTYETPPSAPDRSLPPSIGSSAGGVRPQLPNHPASRKE